MHLPNKACDIIGNDQDKIQLCINIIYQMVLIEGKSKIQNSLLDTELLICIN